MKLNKQSFFWKNFLLVLDLINTDNTERQCYRSTDSKDFPIATMPISRKNPVQIRIPAPARMNRSVLMIARHRCIEMGMQSGPKRSSKVSGWDSSMFISSSIIFVQSDLGSIGHLSTMWTKKNRLVKRWKDVRAEWIDLSLYRDENWKAEIKKTSFFAYPSSFEEKIERNFSFLQSNGWSRINERLSISVTSSSYFIWLNQFFFWKTRRLILSQRLSNELK